MALPSASPFSKPVTERLYTSVVTAHTALTGLNLLRRIIMSGDLREALEDGRLLMVSQPAENSCSNGTHKLIQRLKND
jgi:hypothetical protein